MMGLLCALLTGAGYFYSTGIGEQWWLLWIAPLPILFYAFGQAKGWQVFLAAWGAMALGCASWLRAYLGTLPLPVLFEGLLGPSLLFAMSVMLARRVNRTLGPLAGSFAFAFTWTAVDFLIAFNRGGGAVQSPSAALMGAPILAQAAALFGFPVLTFLISLFPAGIAASLRSRSRVPLALVLALFLLNLAFGYWRMSAPPESTLKVALVDSDNTIGKIHSGDEAAALKAIDAYVAASRQLIGQQIKLIMFPENIARLEPPWIAQAEAKLAALADETDATLIAGFNMPLDGAGRNVSLAFTPHESAPTIYQKRRLVPVLETEWYTPGPGPKTLANGVGLEVCKDMDFHAMLRTDMVATHPKLLAVPAWDFDKDDWSHARVAILRSVENGVPMARNARDGLLTLNDRYGRVTTRVRTVGGFAVAVGELPLAGSGGNTLYNRIGDSFGWFTVLTAIALMLASFWKRKRGAQFSAKGPH